jgi:hypothetical protein
VWVLYLFFFLLLAGSVVNARLRQVDYEEIDEYQSFISLIFYLIILMQEDGPANRSVLDIPDILLGNYTAAAPTHYWRTVFVFALVFELTAVGFYFWQPYASVVVIVAYITGVAAGMLCFTIFRIRLMFFFSPPLSSSGLCLLVGAMIEATQGLILLRKRKMM